MLGGGVAQFRDANGEFVQYTKSDSASLARYIQSLKDEIAGTASGPMRPFFL